MKSKIFAISNYQILSEGIAVQNDEVTNWINNNQPIKIIKIDRIWDNYQVVTTVFYEKLGME